MNVKNAQKDPQKESRGKKLFIPDSSVMIELVSKKKANTHACQKLTNDIHHGNINVAVIPLMYWEVGNWAVRTHPEMATELLSSIVMWDITEYPLDYNIISQAVEIATRFKGVTFYDASFHALAVILNGTFLTNDKAYYKATHTFGNIRLLSDY